MTPTPQKITFGELRNQGVTEILIYCRDHRCSHHTEANADGWGRRRPAVGYLRALQHPRRELFAMLTQFRTPDSGEAADVKPASRRGGGLIPEHTFGERSFKGPDRAPQPAGPLCCLEVSSASGITHELPRSPLQPPRRDQCRRLGR